MAEQQFITNPSITPGALKIELSGGYVTAISGHPVGVTGSGTYYDGDGTYIEIVDKNTITLTDEAAEKLNREIPTTVAELTDADNYLTTADAANTYQTIEGMSDYVGQQEYNDFKSITNSKLNGKQNKLNFGYDVNNAISSIDGHEIAGTGGVTGDYYSASNPSGFINSDQAEAQIIAKKYITSSVSELDNFYSKSQTSGANEIANAIKYFVTEDLLRATSGELENWVSTNYYEKTETSSKTEIENAFDNIPKYILKGDSNITATSAQDGKNIRWDLAVNATPVVTDTTLTGDKGIYTHKTSNSGEWCVELVQSAYDAINDVQNKLDTTAAAQTYQPKGNYVSSTDITDMATKTWVGNQHYLTEVPSEYVTDTELQTTLGDYATNTLVQNTSAAITALIPSTAGLASETDLQIVSAGVNAVSGELPNYLKVSAYEADSGKFALKSEIPTVPTKVSDLTDSANYYKTTETSSKNELTTEFAKYLTNTQYNTDSATFALKSDLNGLVNSASVTTNDNYVMTNSGWKVLTLPGGGMTKVYHDTTLTGDGNANDNQLGVKWETLSSNTIAYSNSAFNLTNGTSVSSFNQISAAIDSRYSKTASDNRYLQKSLDNTLTGEGTDTKKLGVAWSALSSNKIDSAKSANSAEYITNGVGYSGFDDISAKFGSLSSYVPYSATVLPIGTNNTATNNSIAIGASNTADDLGFAVGQSNTALKRSLAFGVNNYANDISLAIGYQNSASGRNDNNQSAVNIAIGYANSAADHAAALINVCTAENYAFAAGHGNSAVDNSVAFCRNTSAKFYSFGFGHLNHVENYSYAFGRDLHYEGQWANGSQYGAFVIGGWNATTSYATTADAPVFIIGNGENGRRSDGFIVYRDGTVKAKDFVAGGNTLSANYPVPKSVPNTGDSTMKIQRMFVCTSDNDIIAHINAGLAEGEGCVFFRVGS